MKPEKFKPEQIAEALRATAGIHVAAAAKLHCSRYTIARMLKRYPKLQKLQDELNEEILDVGESVLVSALKSDDKRVALDAAKFLLKTKGKTRGYVERQETVTPDTLDRDPKDMSLDELRAVREKALHAPRRAR